MRAYLMSLAVAAPALLLGLTACNNTPALSTAKANEVGAAAVTSERLINADREPGSWLAAGLNYHEDRFSKLEQINDTNAFIGGALLSALALIALVLLLEYNSFYQVLVTLSDGAEVAGIKEAEADYREAQTLLERQQALSRHAPVIREQDRQAVVEIEDDGPGKRKKK